jgi:hypothetical protein
MSRGLFRPRQVLLGFRRESSRRQVGRIEIVLAGNPDQREQGIAAGIGEGGSEPVRRCRLADWADWPVRGHPFARGVHKRRGKPDQAAVAVRQCPRRIESVKLSTSMRYMHDDHRALMAALKWSKHYGRDKSAVSPLRNSGGPVHRWFAKSQDHAMVGTKT